jgi:hypothetical protein
LNSARHEVASALEPLVGVAALVKIAEQAENGLLRLPYMILALRECVIGVSAPPSRVSKMVDSIASFSSRSTTAVSRTTNSREAGENGTENAGFNDTGGLGTALIDERFRPKPTWISEMIALKSAW